MGTDLLPFTEVTSIVAAISVLGIFLLLPLYLSQRRDVERLRAWMLQDPGYPASDLARSEARLDRAELTLEQIYAERGDPVPGTAEFQALHADEIATTPAAELPPELRLTSDRPALDRVTMERAALEPHPRWRRFSGLAVQPRWLAVVGIVALALGAAAIVGVQNFVSDDEDAGQTALEESGIRVAVLNTTAADGIAGRVAREIEANGYLRGEVGSLTRETDQTLVMYQPGQKRAAGRIAKELGGVAIQPIDRTAQEAAPESDVVVILGADRASG